LINTLIHSLDIHWSSVFQNLLIHHK